MNLSITQSKTNYSDLLRMPQWMAKRTEVLHRDGYKCRNCGATKALHVHHRQYHTCGVSGIKRLPWEYDKRYLITLCRVCHEAGHLKYSVPTFSIQRKSK